LSYRVVIPTAGTGSRLGVLTKHVNKSLVSLANRPIISHIIEQFPDDVEFVVALGHKGKLVREVLEMAYPSRRFFFPDVDPYEGPGSGLGLSLLACREYLEQPFVFCSCDTLVDESIPPLDCNWMGYAPSTDVRSYRSLRVDGDRVVEICEKNALGDLKGAYVGLCGVLNYEAFWEAMLRGGEAALHMGEAYGLRSLQEQGIRAVKFTWWDTGAREALDIARTRREPEVDANILEKEGEAIWFVNGTVIKYSCDPGFIRQRVERADRLQAYCPELVAHGDHTYQYNRIDGSVLSEVVNLPLFGELLECARGFWSTVHLGPEATESFRAVCLKFYRDKTYERVALFSEVTGLPDRAIPINGEEMPTLATLLERVPWDDLASGLPGRFHGDFHFENIIWNSAAQKFVFLDWRQNFGDDVDVGDIYYDLAKLLHGLIVSHGTVVEELFNVEWSEEKTEFGLMRKQILVDCENEYYAWLSHHGYEVERVRLLTALVFINIAPLHHDPYRLLLLALGKLLLKRSLDSTWK